MTPCTQTHCIKNRKKESYKKSFCSWCIIIYYCCLSIVQSTKSRPTLYDPMNCSTPGFLSFTISQNSLKLMSIELVMLSNHFILCYPLLLLPSIFPSIRVFSNNSVLHIRWPKELQHQSFQRISGLISFTIDWFDLFEVQGTLKSLL